MRNPSCDRGPSGGCAKKGELHFSEASRARGESLILPCRALPCPALSAALTHKRVHFAFWYIVVGFDYAKQRCSLLRPFPLFLSIRFPAFLFRACVYAG